VDSTNTAAAELYEKMGYVPAEEEQKGGGLSSGGARGDGGSSSGSGSGGVGGGQGSGKSSSPLDLGSLFSAAQKQVSYMKKDLGGV